MVLSVASRLSIIIHTTNKTQGIIHKVSFQVGSHSNNERYIVSKMNELRPLCKELQKIAKDELNESEKIIPDDVKYIREWLSMQPHIIARTDYQWLVTFLRGCKYSLEKVKEKIDMYYTVRCLAPEYFEERNPYSPGVQKLLELGIFLPLPKLAHPGAQCIILSRPGLYNPSNTKLEDVFKLYLMTIDILLFENDNLVISGLYLLQDMKNVGLGHMKIISPTLMKKAMTCFQSAYPLRVKGNLFINIPSIFDNMYTLMKPFFSKKIKERMYIYSEKNIDQLYKIVPKSVLPEEYGGQGGSFKEIAENWKKQVQNHKKFFDEDANYKTSEAARPGKPKTTENVFGVEGSFRQLCVD